MRRRDEDAMDGRGLGAVSFETAFQQAIEPATADFDELGHVNNAVYLRWAQEIATRHWFRVASPELVARYLWVVLRHEIDYRDPILPGDAVEARTWLGAANGPRYDRHVDIRKPGSARASASVLSTWCMLDAKTRKPRRVGSEIFEAFQVPA
jgi:acyl-CoA thioester hydrolase